MNEIKNCLCDSEAALYIGMSVSFLKQSRMDGKRENRTPGPPYIRIGRAVRYRKDDLEDWLLAHRHDVDFAGE